MKNIVAGVVTIFILALMVITFNNGRAFQGGEAGNIIEDLKFNDGSKVAQKNSAPEENKNLETDKLKALRDKAGNTGTFKVSNAYKSKCASCHGVDGSGVQNGKKLMGPKLFGQSEETLYKDLVDFKAGRKENLIMKGLLINLSEDDLKEFAKEIGQFKARQEALTK